MAYGTQLFHMSDAARNRGLTASESAMSRLMQAASQANSQAFSSNENRKQREHQEEQRKAQEKAQRKAMWTSLGLSAGTAAAGGAITGGMAAAAPLAGAAVSAGTSAGVSGATQALSSTPDVSMSMGMPEVAPPPAMANTPMTLTGSSPSQASQFGGAPQMQMQPPQYTPFAGGNTSKGALYGGLLGGLGGMSGQNYLGAALAQPGQNYSLAADAFNNANSTALQWAQYGQRDRHNQEDNAAANQRAETMSQSRQYGADASAGARMYGSDASADARMYGSDRSYERGLIPYERGPTPYQQGQLDLGGRRADIAGQGMDLRGRAVDESVRHHGVTEGQGERRTGAYERGYGSGDGRGFAPTISMGPNGASVSGKDLGRVQNAYNQISPPNNFEGVKTRVANDLNGGGNPEGTIAQALKEGAITEDEARLLLSKLPRR